MGVGSDCGLEGFEDEGDIPFTSEFDDVQVDFSGFVNITGIDFSVVDDVEGCFNYHTVIDMRTGKVDGVALGRGLSHVDHRFEYLPND